MRTTLNRAFLIGLVSFLPSAGTGLFAQTVDLKSGLKAYWNFDAKNFKDTAGIFDGTESGSSAIAFTPGKAGFGQALQLDGVDQRVEITGGEPDDLAFQGGSMTVAGWFKVGAFDKSWQALVAKGEGSSWRVHRRGGETGFAHAGGTGEGPAMAEPVNDENWHHFAAISDLNAVNFGTALYIDGVQATSFAGAPNLAANGKRMMIGDNPDANGRFWNGLVDDIAVWDRPLNEKEIGALYNKGAGASLSSLVGSVPVDTDKDGMPDEFEVFNGFNPNDASDAAKDFDKDGATNLQEFVAGTDPVDVTKPVLVSAATAGDFKTVTLTFSEALEAGSATNLANYALSPNLAVTAASVKKNVVTLTTAAQTPGAVAYTVTVNNVVDTSKNAVVANSKASFYSFLNVKDGVLKFSFWGGITGTPVDNLYQDPRWPASPDMTAAVFAFNSRDALPNDSKDNYGASIEGFLTPTESGSYRFFIYSDDASQFFISSDDKEANLAQVAEETGCCNFFTEPDSARTSEPVALIAGKKYFVRQVYKEGGGGDYGQIAWRKEGDTTVAGKLTPIPGKFLSSAVDLPSDPAGAYTQVSPAANAKGVSPAASVTIVHRDGKTAWTAANVSLKYDGQTVIPTVTKDGNVITIKYTPPALSASLAVHTVSLGYLDAGAKAATYDYSFTTGAYSGTTEDKVAGYPGLLMGSSVFTADAAGATGKAGDKAINLTMKGGPVVSFNSAFLAKVNQATANDELTVAFWQKKLDIADSSAFTMNSPGSGNNRGFHAHAPWSNQRIYFDTVGCCDGVTQRIDAAIDTFPGYSGDSTWWTNAYHLFVFTKKGASKNIWVDGKLFLSGESTAKLPVDIDAFYMGSGANGGELSHAIIDDFSVYGKELVEADVVALSKGTLPTALPAAKGLIAYWDFNAAPAAVIGNLKAAVGANGKVKITFDGAGTLQTSTTLNGTFADSAIKSGDEITVDGAALFIRAKR
jgi:hypothetical protein